MLDEKDKQANFNQGGIVSVHDDPYVSGIQYTTHAQTYGWQNLVMNGSVAGGPSCSIRNIIKSHHSHTEHITNITTLIHSMPNIKIK